MPKVYTEFETPKRIPTNPGDEYLDILQESINKKGEKEIIVVGKKNIHDMIQEDLESTKIENILHAVAMGDLNALNQREAFYVDATTMPIEVKKEFDYSAEKYVSMMGTPEFLEIMAPYNKKMKEIQEAGNLKEYQNKVAAQAKFEKDVAAAKGGTNESKQ